jgi:hypothetical protein
MIYLRAVDKAGWTDSVYRTTILDMTPPLVNIQEQDIPQIKDSQYLLNVKVTDKNPDKVFYSINGSKEQELSGTSGYINLTNGKNKVVVRAVDKAGNSGKDSTELVKTGINNSELSNNVEIYPNPVRDYSNIKIKTNKLENISISVYDNLGRVVTRKNEICSGDCDYQIDMTSFLKGMYIYRITDSEGNNYTEKIMKE